VPTICEDAPPVDLFTFLAVGTYDAGGEWTQTGGPVEGLLVGNLFIPTDISGSAPVVFRFTYTVDNGFCTPAATQVTFIVQPTPQAGQSIGSPANLCVGTPNYNLFDLIVPGSFESGGLWTQTLGASLVPVSSGGVATLGNALPGLYEFRYFFNPVGVCDGSEVFVQLIIETTANAGDVDAGADNDFCNSQNSVDLFSLILNEQPGGTWTRMGVNGPIPNAATGELNIFGFTPGSYGYRYSVTATSPCSGSDMVDVIVVITDGPPLNPIVGNATPCPNGLEIYSVTNINPQSIYTWALSSGGTIVTAATGTTIALQWNNMAGGPHLLTMTETNGGCSRVNSLIVNITPTQAGFTFAPISPNGMTIQFTNTSTGVGNSPVYIWNFGDSNTSAAANPTHTYAADGQYNVCLDVIGACGSVQFCQMVNVTMVPVIPCDTIRLTSGLNIISTDVVPADSSCVSVFADLISANNLVNIIGIENGLLQIFDPNQNPVFNTLTHIKRGRGYLVRVNVNDTLVVCGTPIDPGLRIALTAGLNIVGYIPQASTTPAVYFDDLIMTNNLVNAIGIENGLLQIFDPNQNPVFNTLTQIRNSYGYLIRVNNNVPEGGWLLLRILKWKRATNPISSLPTGSPLWRGTPTCRLSILVRKYRLPMPTARCMALCVLWKTDC
jgi:PKD repeat protein